MSQPQTKFFLYEGQTTYPNAHRCVPLGSNGMDPIACYSLLVGCNQTDLGSLAPWGTLEPGWVTPQTALWVEPVQMPAPLSRSPHRQPFWVWPVQMPGELGTPRKPLLPKIFGPVEGPAIHGAPRPHETETPQETAKRPKEFATGSCDVPQV